MARQCSIPTRLLTVLYQEELVLLLGVDAIGLVAGVQGFQAVALSLHVDDLRSGHKAEGELLVGIVACRCTAVGVMAAVSHNVPRTWVIALTTAILIVGIIVVGQA